LVDDPDVHRRILCLDEALDCLSEKILVYLSLSKLGPHLRLVGLLGELLCTLQIILFVQENLDGLNMLLELLVNAKSFVIELVFLLLGDSGELNAIVVVKSVDVVHDLGLVRLDGSEDQQVLQVLIVGEA